MPSGTFLNCPVSRNKTQNLMKLLMDILVVLGSVFLGYIVFMGASILLIKAFFPFLNQEEFELMERTRLAKQSKAKIAG